MEVKIRKMGGFILIGVLSVVFFIFQPFSVVDHKSPEIDPTYHAKVVKFDKSLVMDDNGETNTVIHLEMQVTSGEEKGKAIKVDDDGTFLSGQKEFMVGDEILVSKNDQGGFYLKELVRNKVIYFLFGLFVVIVLAVTGWQGLGSLLGMGFSFLVLFRIVLPGILVGQNPLLMAIIGASLIIPATFSLSHGFTRKTVVAILGTLVALVATGLLAAFFAKMAVLSGLSVEETSYLQVETKKVVDFRGLLLAGMIISVLGIMDDITISQSSIVQQLLNAKKEISFYELYKRAMHVGRDHIASMVNTLVLVYAGASLALLLLFIDYNQSFLEVINYEFMAQEIVQTLVGSIGLILAVPLTTFIACLMLKPNEGGEKEHSGCGHIH